MNLQSIGVFLTIGLALFVFGVRYNKFVANIEKKVWASDDIWQLLEGTAAFQVAGGVLVTLIALGVLDIFISLENQVFQYALFYFMCSGTPMIAGSLKRFGKRVNSWFARSRDRR